MTNLKLVATSKWQKIKHIVNSSGKIWCGMENEIENGKLYDLQNQIGGLCMTISSGYLIAWMELNTK